MSAIEIETVTWMKWTHRDYPQYPGLVETTEPGVRIGGKAGEFLFPEGLVRHLGRDHIEWMLSFDNAADIARSRATGYWDANDLASVAEYSAAEAIIRGTGLDKRPMRERGNLG